MAKAVLEFEEYGSRKEGDYELTTRVNIEGREIMHALYSSNSTRAIKRIGLEVALKLESTGYQDADVLIDQLNRGKGFPVLLSVEGLGHLVKKELVKHHGGKVEVQSINAKVDRR